MTCHYTNSNWLDVLYSDVRRTQGGVADAARFLTERRGRSIHPESLRSKLRGLEGEALSMEMAELLGEWMEEKACSISYAWNWLGVMAMSRGYHLSKVPPPPEGGHADELGAILSKLFDFGIGYGGLLERTKEALKDGVITKEEADTLIPFLDKMVETLHRTKRNIIRAQVKGES